MLILLLQIQIGRACTKLKLLLFIIVSTAIFLFTNWWSQEKRSNSLCNIQPTESAPSCLCLLLLFYVDFSLQMPENVVFSHFLWLTYTLWTWIIAWTPMKSLCLYHAFTMLSIYFQYGITLSKNLTATFLRFYFLLISSSLLRYGFHIACYLPIRCFYLLPDCTSVAVAHIKSPLKAPNEYQALTGTQPSHLPLNIA